MLPPATVLVVDDEDHILGLVRNALASRYQVLCAHDVQEAEAVLGAQPVQVVMCDQHMPGEKGLSFLSRIRYTHPETARILLTGGSDTPLVLDAINRGGVCRYLVKPASVDDLRQAVALALTEYAAVRPAPAPGTDPSEDEAPRPAQVWGGLLLTGLGGLLAVLVLGMLVLLVLYFLKSALGFDLFPSMHLKDLF